MDNWTCFRFKRTGLQTTVQDTGRVGYQHYGVPIGGVMDSASAKIANWLVGNEMHMPVLEITLTGPEISIQGDCQLAITGAHMSPSINGKRIPMYETINVTSKATLTFGKLHSGCRTYLAIRGRWKLKKWLDSSSASLYHGAELTPDSVIKKGHELLVNTLPEITKKTYPKTALPMYGNGAEIRMLPGPEFRMFTKKSTRHFFTRSYRITKDAGRMAYPLDAVISNFKPYKEMISSGTLPGTIQVTHSGQPIILMADAQTTGGYLRFGNVVKPDMNRLAQLRPGGHVTFSLVNV